jgi:stage IV sporulation protein FB
MKIHYSILIVLIFALYTNSLVEFALFFGCIVLHEMGHVFFIYLFKQKVNKLNISIFGGQLDCNLKNLNILQNVLINLGGIFVNFLLIKISFLIPKYQALLISYNYLLIIFNILPIYPLDGYRIVESLMIVFKSPHYEFFMLSCFSMFFLLALLIFGLIVQSLAITIIGIILIYKNIQRIINKDRIVLKKLVEMFS